VLALWLAGQHPLLWLQAALLVAPLLQLFVLLVPVGVVKVEVEEGVGAGVLMLPLLPLAVWVADGLMMAAVMAQVFLLL
jgi:hypothetical protein